MRNNTATKHARRASYEFSNTRAVSPAWTLLCCFHISSDFMLGERSAILLVCSRTIPLLRIAPVLSFMHFAFGS